MEIPNWAMKAFKEARDTGEYENWDPQPGDVINGTVAGWDSADTKYGTKQVLRVDAGDTQFAVLVSRMVLVNQLANAAKRIDRERLEPGDDVVIQYNGLRESKNGNSYHDYLVAARAGEAKGSADGLPF